VAPTAAPPWAMMRPRRSSPSPLRFGLSPLLPPGRGLFLLGFCSSPGFAEDDLVEYTSSDVSTEKLFDFVVERVALFSSVADRPMVLAVLTTVDIEWWGLLSGRGK